MKNATSTDRDHGSDAPECAPFKYRMVLKFDGFERVVEGEYPAPVSETRPIIDVDRASELCNAVGKARRDALEEAAKVCEQGPCGNAWANGARAACAESIRDLKGKPSTASCVAVPMSDLERAVLDTSMSWYRWTVKEFMDQHDYRGESQKAWLACDALATSQCERDGE